MKKKIKNVVIFITLLISSIIIVGSVYYSVAYSAQEFDQIIYYLLNGIDRTAPSIVNKVILTCSIPVIILFGILYLFTRNKSKDKISIIIKIRKKEFKFPIYPIKAIARHRGRYAIIVFIIALIVFIFGFKVNKYIMNIVQKTDIYDKYYVDGKNVDIKFPEKKRNLIIIVSESMENSLLSKKNGGAWENTIIPELEKLALENTNFSHTELIGGARQANGASFSAGGIAAMTSGVSLAAPRVTENNAYKGKGNYLNGAYNLGDVLKKEGYNLEVMMGSDSNFGGRNNYFKRHGDYKIFDVNYAIEQGKMKTSDKVWWGFEDDKLFKWSKEEITNLASKDEPFNYIMATADTHFVDGYLSKYAEKKYETQYENVHAYSSKSIYEFVEWVKKQDFYENTTIVILGDHLGMQTEFYEAKADKDYLRTIYNVIINPAITTTNNKNRTFTTMDMYPTILASIGAEIEGNRLGLGTNLYSSIPTLSEELGFKYFNNEIRKYSSYYSENILGDF